LASPPRPPRFHLTAIPAYVQGSHGILPKGARWPRRGHLRVRLGEPVCYPDEPDTREGWKGIAADLGRRVGALAPSSEGSVSASGPAWRWHTIAGQSR
jgi:hypothetical protein